MGRSEPRTAHVSTRVTTPTAGMTATAALGKRRARIHEHHHQNSDVPFHLLLQKPLAIDRLKGQSGGQGGRLRQPSAFWRVSAATDQPPRRAQRGQVFMGTLLCGYVCTGP